MVTCLASLFSGRLVRSDVAMTGEITLRGLVLPVSPRASPPRVTFSFIRNRSLNLKVVCLLPLNALVLNRQKMFTAIIHIFKLYQTPKQFSHVFSPKNEDLLRASQVVGGVGDTGCLAGDPGLCSTSKVFPAGHRHEVGRGWCDTQPSWRLGLLGASALPQSISGLSWWTWR